MGKFKDWLKKQLLTNDEQDERKVLEEVAMIEAVASGLKRGEGADYTGGTTMSHADFIKAYKDQQNEPLKRRGKSVAQKGPSTKKGKHAMTEEQTR